MEDVVIPFQASPGMGVTASFVDDGNEYGHRDDAGFPPRESML
jgi:hypothetical protein